MNSSILAPAIVLVIWSLVITAWLAATRLPAMKKARIDLASVVGGRGADLEGVLPERVMWVSHNYAHLMEQPTIFYATVAILALAGAGDGVNLQLAWGYVMLRIVHSIVQITWNRLVVRFAIFALSTLVLLVMAINAARAVF
jgi:hypothetical protein